MSSLPSQLSPARLLARTVAVLLVSGGLGGCLGRGTAETTGSIGGSGQAQMSEAALRSASETQGKRFESDPGNAGAALEYAQTLKALGQTTQAVAVLQQSAIRNPKSLPVLGAYGKALADAGRFREASEVLPRAHTPERPDWRILSVQGAVAGQLGDLDGATGYYMAALKIVPGEPSVLSNMGLTYALAKRLGEAETVLRQAASHPRADARVRQNLALVLGLQGKLAEAETILKQDLPPAEAAQTLAGIKGMVSQPNSWKAIKQSENPTPRPGRSG